MTFWAKKRIRNIPKAQFVHVYVHGMNIWRPKLMQNAPKNTQKVHYVHVYVHGMLFWGRHFDQKRNQKCAKTAFRTRIRARNEHSTKMR